MITHPYVLTIEKKRKKETRAINIECAHNVCVRMCFAQQSLNEYRIN